MNKLADDTNEDKQDQLALGEQFSNQYLTKREIQVLKYVILGYPAKKIGQTLKISSRTVEGYVDRLKEKLGCNSRGEISFKVIKTGLINLLDIL